MDGECQAESFLQLMYRRIDMKKFETKWNELYESQRNMQLKRSIEKWVNRSQKSKRKNENYECLPNLTERRTNERKDNKWKIS